MENVKLVKFKNMPSERNKRFIWTFIHITFLLLLTDLYILSFLLELKYNLNIILRNALSENDRMNDE